MVGSVPVKNGPGLPPFGKPFII